MGLGGGEEEEADGVRGWVEEVESLVLGGPLQGEERVGLTQTGKIAEKSPGLGAVAEETAGARILSSRDVETSIQSVQGEVHNGAQVCESEQE